MTRSPVGDRQQAGRPVRPGLRLGSLLLATAIIGTSCASTPTRADVLEQLSDQVIVPAYTALAASTDQLESAVGELCESGQAEALARTRAALAEARARWSYTEVMWVGPVMERRSWAVIDWPVSPLEIEALIADTGTELDQQRLGSRIGADQRGLGAVEYILGGADTGPEDLDDRRCDYLTGIAAVIAEEARSLPTDWSQRWEDGDPYRTVFAAADGDGLDGVVNETLFLLEAMADAELGTALGLMDQPPSTDAIVEGPAGLGAADLAAHLAGLRAVFLGVGNNGDEVGDEDREDAAGLGLSPLLDDELTERLTVQFDAAEEAVGALDGPLTVLTTESPDQVGAARDALKGLQVTVATEVVAALGVTIGFSDADGDTG